jgi:hypothetical protein
MTLAPSRPLCPRTQAYALWKAAVHHHVPPPTLPKDVKSAGIIDDEHQGPASIERIPTLAATGQPQPGNVAPPMGVGQVHLNAQGDWRQSRGTSAPNDHGGEGAGVGASSAAASELQAAPAAGQAGDVAQRPRASPNSGTTESDDESGSSSSSSSSSSSTGRSSSSSGGRRLRTWGKPARQRRRRTHRPLPQLARSPGTAAGVNPGDAAHAAQASPMDQQPATLQVAQLAVQAMGAAAAGKAIASRNALARRELAYSVVSGTHAAVAAKWPVGPPPWQTSSHQRTVHSAAVYVPAHTPGRGDDGRRFRSGNYGTDEPTGSVRTVENSWSSMYPSHGSSALCHELRAAYVTPDNLSATVHRPQVWRQEEVNSACGQQCQRRAWRPWQRNPYAAQSADVVQALHSAVADGQGQQSQHKACEEAACGRSSVTISNRPEALPVSPSSGSFPNTINQTPTGPGNPGLSLKVFARAHVPGATGVQQMATATLRDRADMGESDGNGPLPGQLLV